jgi:hypothetical protein
MMNVYTGASYSIAARPRHRLNSLTLTTATRPVRPRPNMIRIVDARSTILFLTRAAVAIHLVAPQEVVQPVFEHERPDAVDDLLHATPQDVLAGGREERAHAAGVVAAQGRRRLDEDDDAVKDGLDLGDEQLGLGPVADHGGHAADGVVAGGGT